MPKVKVIPVLVMYKELTQADLRKLVATSNDAPSGGGARDLRLPHSAFKNVMAQLLPGVRQERRGKNIDPDAIVQFGSVHYFDNDVEMQTELVYWPPTDARPAEGRIAKVHSSPALGGRLPDDDKGRVFVMFIKWQNAMVQVVYAYEDDLRKDEWAPEVSGPILKCLRDSDLRGKSVQGYIDLMEDRGYCHGE
jgi:hypothetical protein